MRIIFMGTPEFAVTSLEALLKEDFEIIAVITATDKVGGRGNKTLISPVKECALKHGIKVLQPPNLKNPEFVEDLRSLKADLQIVVAFRMLPEVVWSMPPLGTFNLHASLLPDYRGAAPINWAIINGEKETGASTFLLKHEIDTGNIIFQEKEPIYPEDNAGTLYERLKVLGAGLVTKTAQAIQNDDCQAQPQPPVEIEKKAPKIHRETCEIDWGKKAEDVHNFIRGLSPYPAAWTRLLDKNCKIYRTSLSIPEAAQKVGLKSGEYESDDKSYLVFQTGTGKIAIEELQLEGKKRMSIQAFLAGNKLNEHE